MNRVNRAFEDQNLLKLHIFILIPPNINKITILKFELLSHSLYEPDLDIINVCHVCEFEKMIGMIASKKFQLRKRLLPKQVQKRKIMKSGMAMLYKS